MLEKIIIESSFNLEKDELNFNNDNPDLDSGFLSRFINWGCGF